MDVTDYFHIATMSYTNGPVFTVAVNGHAGRHYTLQQTSALNPASWTGVDTQTASADNQTIVLHDSISPDSQQIFLRVAVNYP